MNESTGLNRFRENTVQLYKRLEYLLVPVFRFAVALSLLLLLRRHLGAHGPADAVLGSTLLNVILALVCSMFPPGCTALIVSLVMMWYLYRISLEAAAICAALLLLCLLLYFRFSPKDTMILLLMPAAYALNLHYAVPVFAGLLYGPGAAAAVIFGLLFTRFVLLVEESLPVIGSTAQAALPTGERLIANFRSLIDGMVQDKSMLILAATLALTVMVVCFFRHLVMAHAWTVAIAAGCILELLLLLAGDMKFDTNIDLTKVFAGIVLAFVLAQILRFFAYNVDFLRIESVQFEDEDYYYYVRAIPKTMVLPPVTNVEHFSQPGAKERE